MPVLIALFVGLAVVIVVAGTYLTKFSDQLGAAAGLSRSLSGLAELTGVVHNCR